MTSARWTITSANTGTFDLFGLCPPQAGDHDPSGISAPKAASSSKSGARQTPTRRFSLVC
jgi:hypothetical protein